MSVPPATSPALERELQLHEQSEKTLREFCQQWSIDPATSEGVRHAFGRLATHRIGFLGGEELDSSFGRDAFGNSDFRKWSLEVVENPLKTQSRGRTNATHYNFGLYIWIEDQYFSSMRAAFHRDRLPITQKDYEKFCLAHPLQEANQNDTRVLWFPNSREGVRTVEISAGNWWTLHPHRSYCSLWKHRHGEEVCRAEKDAVATAKVVVCSYDFLRTKEKSLFRSNSNSTESSGSSLARVFGRFGRSSSESKSSSLAHPDSLPRYKQWRSKLYDLASLAHNCVSPHD